MTQIKNALKAAFEMTDCGDIHYFLGIQIQRDQQNHTITLSQEHFIEQVLRRFRMSDAKPAATPLDVSVKLIQATEDENSLTVDPAR